MSNNIKTMDKLLDELDDYLKTIIETNKEKEKNVRLLVDCVKEVKDAKIFKDKAVDIDIIYSPSTWVGDKTEEIEEQSIVIYTLERGFTFKTYIGYVKDDNRNYFYFSYCDNHDIIRDSWYNIKEKILKIDS